MPDTEPAAVATKKHRSPAYPFIPLEKALQRAREFYNSERRHAAPVGAAIKCWGFSEKSSGGQQTVGALKQYGLMSDDGSGGDRRIRLTELALKILLDEVPNSADRAAALRAAALAPKLFEDMFSLWGLDLPSDETIRTLLRRDKGFNDDVLPAVLRSYKETLSYSGLLNADIVTEPSREDDPLPQVAVGDYVQWTSQGADQFVTPRKVWMVSPDGAFAMVEGSATGIPMEQLVKTDPPARPIQGAHIPSTAQLFPPSSPPSIAREVSSLPEGEAVLQWPAILSPESVQDLEDWLELLIKKLKRRYATDGKS
jgi:hypothetical protein